MKPKKSYGWVPDVPDQRDYAYGAARPRMKLPPSIDLRKGCSVVEDQGALGSCTAQALAGHLEFLDNLGDNQYTDVSRLLIYYNERRLRGTVLSDSGAAIRDGIKTLAKLGSCPEKAWPYVIAQFTDSPPTVCYTAALKNRIVSYHRLHAINDMLTCLTDGYPFVFGFTVYESFESPQVTRTGAVPMPAKSEKVLGGHAVMAVGFDQKTKRFLARNSWGIKWGQKGYGTMPFTYLESLARDFWTIRK